MLPQKRKTGTKKIYGDNQVAVCLRFLVEDYQNICKAADVQGISLSDFVRNCSRKAAMRVIKKCQK